MMTEDDYKVLGLFYKYKSLTWEQFEKLFRTAEFINVSTGTAGATVERFLKANILYYETKEFEENVMLHTISQEGEALYFNETERRRLIAEDEMLVKEKLRIETKNIKRVYKTYWWTFGFSVVALVISLILLMLKIISR